MKEPGSIHDELMERQDGQASIDRGTQDHGRKNMIRTIILTIIGTVVVGGVCLALWQLQLINKVFAPSAYSQKSSRVSSQKTPDNLFARHAADAGVATCQGMYAMLGDALTEGGRYMVKTEMASSNPNLHSLQGLVGLQYQNQGNNNGSAAGIVFAAPTPTGQNCEGTMVRVVPFAQNCQVAANLLPQGSRQGEALSGVPTFTMPNGGHVMLLPSGNSCVVLSVVRGAA